jgi:hypothetical protein
MSFGFRHLIAASIVSFAALLFAEYPSMALGGGPMAHLADTVSVTAGSIASWANCHWRHVAS